MNRFSRIILAVIITAIAVLAAFLAANLAVRLQSPKPQPQEKLPEIVRLPEFSLQTSSGGALSLQGLRGKIWVADFIFTHCPGTCPLLSTKMQKIQEELKRLPPDLRARVRLVSFSVDPDRDRPERLSEYASGYRADPDLWLFATGARGEVEELAKGGFRLPIERAGGGSPAKEEIIHSTRLALVDARGTVRAYYSGIDDPAISPVLEGIGKLLSEAEAPDAAGDADRPRKP